MLIQRAASRSRLLLRRRQSGVVMLVALIVLVVMTLAGIALMRSMDTTNLIAGNMAFKQASINASDAGVEAALMILQANSGLGGLDANLPAVGYTAMTNDNSQYTANALGQANATAFGDAFWNFLRPNGVCNLPVAGGACSANAVADPVTGNAVSFMIQRLCSAQGSRTSPGVNCAVVPGNVVSTGNNQGAGVLLPNIRSNDLYYRITVRVVGPRNTVSYIQALVSM